MAEEYIERNALLQDIVETVVFSTKTGERNSEIKGAKKVIGRIQAVPTADVVEVVRCKDCNYFSKATVNTKGFLLCSVSGMEIIDNDFCSYGVKRR